MVFAGICKISWDSVQLTQTTLKTMETIATLDKTQADQLLDWCSRQELGPEHYAGKLTARRQKWWGLEAEILGSSGRWLVHQRDAIQSDEYLASLKAKYRPDANSVLLYRYEIGAGIGEHSDKDCFEPMVVLVNLIDELPDLFGGRPPCRFRYGSKPGKAGTFESVPRYLDLQHGQIVQFNSRVLHGLPKLKTARYSLQFRRVVTP